MQCSFKFKKTFVNTVWQWVVTFPCAIRGKGQRAIVQYTDYNHTVTVHSASCHTNITEPKTHGSHSAYSAANVTINVLLALY